MTGIWKEKWSLLLPLWVENSQSRRRPESQVPAHGECSPWRSACLKATRWSPVATDRCGAGRSQTGRPAMCLQEQVTGMPQLATLNVLVAE